MSAANQPLSTVNQALLRRVAKVSISVLLAVMFGSMSFVAYRAASRPVSIGLDVAWDTATETAVVTRVQPISPAEDHGIRPGDVVTLIDGHEPRSSDVPIAPTSSVAVLKTGESTPETISVEASASDLVEFLVISWAFFAIALVALVGGHGQAPRALAVFTLTGAVELAVYQAAYRQVPWTLVVHGIATPLFMASFAYLSLVFPAKRRLAVWRLRLPAWLPLAVAVPMVITWVVATQLPVAQFAAIQPVGFIYAALCLAIGCWGLVTSWRSMSGRRERTQVRIAVFGSVIGVLPFVVFSLVPRAIAGSYVLAPAYTLLGLVLIPLSFAYAILRYQLMDLHLYIRRGIVYTALVTIIAATYALVLFLATLVIQSRAGVENVFAVAAIGALLAFAGMPLRSALERRVDRLFDRRRYDYRQQLLDFSARMSGLLDAGALGRSTVDLVARTMAPTFTRLYRKDDGEAVFRFWLASEPVPVGFDERLPVSAVQDGSAWSAGTIVQRFTAGPDEVALLVPLVNKGRAIGVLTLGPKRADVPYTSEDIALLETVANQLAVALDNAQLYEHTRTLYVSGIRTLAATVDAKDPYTHGHSERVSAYARMIAVELGLPASEVENIEIAGLLHDIGKIGVPDAILQKPGRLDPAERALMREHPDVGAKILRDNLALTPLVPYVRHHHERYDGHGYPDGLVGDDIPLGAAIIAVADTFDTMTTDRPYRKALPLTDALAELRRVRGAQLHPRAVDAFLRLIQRGAVDSVMAGPAETELAWPHFASEPVTSADARAMRTVYEVVEAIEEVTDIDAFLTRVVELVRQELGIGQITLFLVGVERAWSAATGQPAGLIAKEPSLRPLRTLAEEVAESRQPVRVSDTATDTRTMDSSLASRSVLLVPLLSEHQAIGVIAAESQRPAAFSPQDEAILQVVSQQLTHVVQVARLHDETKQLAYADGLTGLANHRRFYERLELAVATASGTGGPLSIVLIDVDGLKRLNDTHGHLVGDAALRAIAAILRDAAYPEDTVARYGGDEFAVILPGLDAHDASAFAEAVTASVASPDGRLPEGLSRLPSISWGIAAFGADGDRAVDLVSVADTRMYARKRQRRPDSTSYQSLLAD